MNVGQIWVPNPLTIALDQVWAYCDASNELAEIIKDGNRIKYNSTISSLMKRNVQVADLPELMIMPETANPSFTLNSSSGGWDWTLAGLVSTGEPRYNAIMAQIHWVMFKALGSLREEGLEIKYRGEKFLYGIAMLQNVDGLNVSTQNRGIKGWASSIRFDLKMQLHKEWMRTDVQQAELVTDPNFANGQWSGAWTLGIGQVDAPAVNGQHSIPVALTDGARYRVSVYVRQENGGGVVVALGSTTGINTSEIGYHTAEIVAPAGANDLILTGNNVTVAYASVKEIK